jgi:hypothetical protein
MKEMVGSMLRGQLVQLIRDLIPASEEGCNRRKVGRKAQQDD